MDVLKRINQLRINRDWSIYRLSVESGISQSTLTNMFNRGTLPSVTTLECLCEAFKITMSDFFLEENENSSKDLEKEFLTLYHQISPEAQNSILVLLRELKKE